MKRFILKYEVSKDMIKNNRLTVPVEYNLNVIESIGNVFLKEEQKQPVTIVFDGIEYYAYFAAHINSNNPKVENKYILLFFSAMKQIVSSLNAGDFFILTSDDKPFVFNAEIIKTGNNANSPDEPSGHISDEEEEIISAIEGQVREINYVGRRRNLQLKNEFLKQHGYYCDVCGLNLLEAYGDLGKVCIDVHHKNPLAESDGERITTFSDLAALCPNCHAIIHRNRNLNLSVEQLKDILQSRSKG